VSLSSSSFFFFSRTLLLFIGVVGIAVVPKLLPHQRRHVPYRHHHCDGDVDVDPNQKKEEQE